MGKDWELLLLMSLHGQSLADGLIGLDLAVDVRWAGSRSSSGLSRFLDVGLRPGNGGRVGQNDLVDGRGVSRALLGAGIHQNDALRLLLRLRLLVGRG